MINTEEVNAAIFTARKWFILFGAIMISLGLIAIVFPLATSVAAKIFFGWLLLIGGGAQVFHAFSSQRWAGFIFDLAGGALFLVVGAWLAFFPLAGLITLTVLLAATFIAQGILEIAMGLNLRPLGGWIWVLFAGVLAAIVGILILAKLPSSAAWAIGLLVGINLLSSGIAYLFLGLTAGRNGAAK